MQELDDASATALRQPALLKAAIQLHGCPARHIHADRLAGLGFADPASVPRNT